MKLARHGLRPGDVLLILSGLAAVLLLARHHWGEGGAGRVLVRSDGRPYAELSLAVAQRIVIPGPLGQTEIEVRDGRVRVTKDPGPRQLCVGQGWLSRSGELAVCLPNRISIEVLGRAVSHDSLAY